MACSLFVIINLSISWLVADWVKYDTQATLDQMDGFELLTMDWKQELA